MPSIYQSERIAHMMIQDVASLRLLTEITEELLQFEKLDFIFDLGDPELVEDLSPIEV